MARQITSVFLVSGAGVVAVIRTGRGIPSPEVNAKLGDLSGVVDYDMREVIQRRTRFPTSPRGRCPWRATTARVLCRGSP